MLCIVLIMSNIRELIGRLFQIPLKIVPVGFRKNNKVMKSKQSFTDRILGLQGNLLSFAYQLTTNREQAQDLLRDTTLKALDNEDKYVDNVNFKGWIFTIMRNIFINNYRQTVRKATVIDQTEDLYHLNVCQDSGLTTPRVPTLSKRYRKPSMHSPMIIAFRSTCLLSGIKIQ